MNNNELGVSQPVSRDILNWNVTLRTSKLSCSILK